MTPSRRCVLSNGHSGPRHHAFDRLDIDGLLWATATKLAPLYADEWPSVRDLVQLFAGEGADAWAKELDEVLASLLAGLSVARFDSVFECVPQLHDSRRPLSSSAAARNEVVANQRHDQCTLWRPKRHPSRRAPHRPRARPEASTAALATPPRCAPRCAPRRPSSMKNAPAVKARVN